MQDANTAPKDVVVKSFIVLIYINILYQTV